MKKKIIKNIDITENLIQRKADLFNNKSLEEVKKYIERVGKKGEQAKFIDICVVGELIKRMGLKVEYNKQDYARNKI